MRSVFHHSFITLFSFNHSQCSFHSGDGKNLFCFWDIVVTEQQEFLEIHLWVVGAGLLALK